jgi:hypothetical protein
MEQFLHREVSLEKSQRLAPHAGINGRGRSVNVTVAALATAFRCHVFILFNCPVILYTYPNRLTKLIVFQGYEYISAVVRKFWF